MADPHVELFKGQGAQPWRFRLVGGNGETMAQSEGYLTKWNAKRAARRAFGSLRLVEKT